MKLQAAVRLIADAEDDYEIALYKLDDWIGGGSFNPSMADQRKSLQAFKLLRKTIPKQTMPTVVYRGFVLKKVQLKQAISSELPLKPRLVSAWTSDPKIALNYADNFYGSNEIGVIVAIKTPKSALLFIDKPLIKKLLKIKLLLDQKEIIMEGNGISDINKKNILAVVGEDGVPIRLKDYTG